MTNNPEVLSTIPKEGRSLRFLELADGRLPTHRALGVIWDSKEDVLKFSGPVGTPARTKCQILSWSFSIWDPRGLILPFSIRAKMLLQKFHHRKIGWDDQIDNDELKEWYTWCNEVNQLKKIAIPRAVVSHAEGATKTEIHVFSDVSQEAYGTCSYLRREFNNRSVECRLAKAK